MEKEISMSKTTSIINIIPDDIVKKLNENPVMPPTAVFSIEDPVERYIPSGELYIYDDLNNMVTDDSSGSIVIAGKTSNR